MTVSIIIPTLHDEQALRSLLSSIRAWDDKTQQLIEEIIVVDATASKECDTICKQYNSSWLSFKKNRGAQLKFGAAHAKAEILWFLHADAQVESKMLKEIVVAMQNNALGGFFKFKFKTDNTTLSQNLISYFTNLRSKHFTAYGDQGIFITNEFYKKCEGHSDQELFEEVRLIKSLRKSKKLHISNVFLPVNTRRWERDGYWKRTLHNRLLALAYKFGVSTEKLSQWYTAKKVQ